MTKLQHGMLVSGLAQVQQFGESGKGDDIEPSTRWTGSPVLSQLRVRYMVHGVPQTLLLFCRSGNGSTAPFYRELVLFVYGDNLGDTLGLEGINWPACSIQYSGRRGALPVRDKLTRHGFSRLTDLSRM